MDQSIFMNKDCIPSEIELTSALGQSAGFWNEISEFVLLKYPKAIKEWSYPGKNYGWSFRLKDKKRAIIYLLPRDGYFKVAFVFGQKATDHILESDVAISIKEELASARVYAEGRGIRLDIKEQADLNDIKKLVKIKLSS